MGRKIGATGLVQHSDKFNGMYRGTVMDNVDPLKLGRIKIKIYPMLSGVETTNLPWAVPAMSLSMGAGVGYGTFSVPDIGTNLFIFFEMGDIYQPVYFAEATDGKKGLPTAKDTDYPDTSVVRTKTGIQIKINRKSGSEDITVIHPKGSSIQMNKDGSIFITATVGTTITAQNIYLDAPVVHTSKKLEVGTAATGTFPDGNGKTISVQAGIVTALE